MKKLLIASTALVATAGMAAADVTVTGHAAAGIHSGLDDVLQQLHNRHRRRRRIQQRWCRLHNDRRN